MRALVVRFPEIAYFVAFSLFPVRFLSHNYARRLGRCAFGRGESICARRRRNAEPKLVPSTDWPGGERRTTSQRVFVRLQKSLKSSNFLMRALKAQEISATSRNTQCPGSARPTRAQTRVGLDRALEAGFQEKIVAIRSTVLVSSSGLTT